MEKVLEGRPVESFSPPPGLVFVKIDPKTGLLAPPASESGVFACYLEGTEPTAYADVDREGKRSFFRLDMNRAEDLSPEEDEDDTPDESPL